jgi:hypothetical protein
MEDRCGATCALPSKFQCRSTEYYGCNSFAGFEEKTFAEVKPGRSRHVQVEIGVMHVMKAPEKRHPMHGVLPPVKPQSMRRKLVIATTIPGKGIQWSNPKCARAAHIEIASAERKNDGNAAGISIAEKARARRDKRRSDCRRNRAAE